MSVTYPQAIDAIFTQFNTAWQAASGICGYVPEIVWPLTDSKPDSSKIWARVSTQTVFEAQGALGQVNASGQRDYQSSGLVFVQMFFPKVPANVAISRQIAKLARDAFRAQNADVWFRNARIRELEDENGMLRFNATAEYEFNELV
jgi:hypothetical protein